MARAVPQDLPVGGGADHRLHPQLLEKSLPQHTAAVVQHGPGQADLDALVFHIHVLASFVDGGRSDDGHREVLFYTISPQMARPFSPKKAPGGGGRLAMFPAFRSCTNSRSIQIREPRSPVARRKIAGILCVFQDLSTQPAAIWAAKLGAEAIGTASHDIVPVRPHYNQS